MLDRYRTDDEDERDALMRAFEAFDDGALSAVNAHEFDLPAPPADGDKDGSAGDEGENKPDTDKDSRDTARDQRGRFAKAGDEGEKKPDSLAPADAGKPGAQSQQDQQPPAEAPAAVAPEPAPSGMGEKASRLWATATTEQRDYMRETEEVIAHVRGGIQPLHAEAKEHNLPWNEYAQRLVNADKYIRRSPVEAMLWLAETHGVDLDAVADMAAAKRAGMTIPSSSGAPTPPQHNAALQPLQQQIQQIAGRLDQREQREHQARQDEATARQRAVRAEMDAYTSKQPHWKAVEAEALALIPAIHAQSPNASVTDIVSTAYERACWANPTVRSQLQKSQDRQAQEARRAQRATAASSATGHRSASPASAAPTKPRANGHDDLVGEISAAFEAYDSR